MEKEGLKHCMLVFYTLRYLPQKDKVKVLRELHGYNESKYGKQYEHLGLVQKSDGQKLGSNVILIPIHNFAEIQNFFSRNNVKTEIKEVWVK